MATRPPHSFGDLLRSYRSAAGLTQEELAARAGMSARGISDLERGARRTPYKGTVELLATALQLTPHQRSAFITAAARKRRDTPPSLDITPNALSSVVGRQEEMAVLQRFLQGSGPPVTLFAGEPGIGKTQLLHEAAARARAAGWTVLTGSCSRRGGQLLYAPLLEALAGHMQAQAQEDLRADLQGCAWLTRLLPELAEQGLLPLPTVQVSPEQERRLLFTTVARYLTTIAGHAGTLLVLDDLQWAGADAFDLLISLLRTTPALRVVGAYRTNEVSRNDPLSSLLADLAREGMVRQVEPGPLSPDEARALLKSVWEGRTENDETLIERILARAGGVPFFLISCVRGLQAGALDANEEAIALPWDIQQTIRQRVAALPLAAQELLAVAAVVGRVIPAEIMVAATERPGQEVLAALETACQSRLLVEEADSYQFAHDLIREVVEADLSAARRRALHRQVAALWEQRGEQCPPEALAYHYAQAGELSIALGHLMHAAQHAKQGGAHREEAALLKQAIDFAEQTGQQHLALELRIRRGTAFWGATLWAEAQTELKAALGQLGTEQKIQRTEVLNILAELHHWLLDVPGLRRCAGEALELAEEIGRDDLAARAMCALAQADSSDGQTETALSYVSRALARAGDAHLAELSSGMLLSGMLHYWLGHFQDAVESSRRALDLARQSYDTFLMAQTLGNLGLALAGTGRYAEAFETFEQARRVAQERGTRPWLARALACRGGVHLDLFDFAGAEALALEAREVSRSVHWPQSETSAGIDLLLNYARRGEVGRAELLLDEVTRAVAASQGAHGWLWRMRFATARGEIALARGAWEDAAHEAEEVIVQSQRTGRLKYQARGLEILAQAKAKTGHTHEARALLQKAVDLVRPTGDPAMFVQAAAALLSLWDNDALLAEARTRAQAIGDALPAKDLRSRFLHAEIVRPLLLSPMP
jgi:predicted ATPase/DNA-binding XRE family transcriptional regulator